MAKEKSIKIVDGKISAIVDMAVGDIGMAVYDYLEDDEKGVEQLSRVLQGKDDKKTSQYLVKNLQEFPTLRASIEQLLQEICRYVREIDPGEEG